MQKMITTYTIITILFLCYKYLLQNKLETCIYSYQLLHYLMKLGPKNDDKVFNQGYTFSV